jgi:hypothetical protein
MAVKSSDVRALSGLVEREPSHALDWVRNLFVRIRVQLGFAAAALALYFGYAGRDSRDLTAEEGLGYALGYCSVALMLLLLIFPLRKRIGLLRFLGPTKDWFRNHMMFGVLAPIAGLYHCNFATGSVNGRMALYSALAVAGSGVVGRFIYTKINRGLHGHRASLKELVGRIRSTLPEEAKTLTFAPELIRKVTEFDRGVLSPPKSLLDCFKLPLTLAYRTRVEQWRLVRFARRKIMVESIYSPTVSANRRKLEKAMSRYIASHLSQVRRVAGYTAYQRLFSLWHKVHLPFFVLLVITVSVHIYAVHNY